MTLEQEGHDLAANKSISQKNEYHKKGVARAVADAAIEPAAIDKPSATETSHSEDRDQFYLAEDGTGDPAKERKSENVASPAQAKSKDDIHEQRISPNPEGPVHVANLIINEAATSSSSNEDKNRVFNGAEQSSQPTGSAMKHSEVMSDAERSNASKPEAKASTEDSSHVSSNGLESDNDTGKDKKSPNDEWQEMPALAEYDIYDDNGRLIARGSVDEHVEALGYNNLGGAAKGYTRVQIDEDAQSATSMDDNTAYLFKEAGKDIVEDDEEARNPMEQMQATKDLLTDGQRIAYVGTTRLAMMEMIDELEQLERTRKIKKEVDVAVESMKMWGQKIMVRLHGHMDISSAGILSSFAPFPSVEYVTN